MVATIHQLGVRAVWSALVATAVWGCASASEDSPAESAAVAAVWPDEEWETVTPAEAGMDATLLEEARDYALTADGAGYIVRNGKLVMSWGDPHQRFDIKSATKSFGAFAVLLGIHDQKIDLRERLSRCRPGVVEDLEGSPPDAWVEGLTLFHLATQTAGFSKRGVFGELLFQPGTQWHYSDSGPNWLAECLTLRYGRDLQEVMFDRVFQPIGISREDLTWRQNSYRPHEIGGITRREFGAGIHASVDALARFGLLHLRGGHWRDQQIVSRELVALATGTHPEIVDLPVYPDTAGVLDATAPQHYGLLWWNNADETLEGVPLDTYIAWGLYEGLIIVVPSLDLVVTRAGPNRSWARTEDMGHYDVLKPFLGPIVESIRRGGGASVAADIPAPYPQSPVIRSVEWAAEPEILRLAEGSDNWAATVGDDGALYAAYGDGWGFEPLLDEKLSLGFTRVEGTPPDLQAINLRSPTGEQYGGGASGKKASGMLMVEGILYMWARNAANSQLAWSSDRGRTWTWADWKFTTSFGAPTFLNFGPNYSGARDGYVYVFSHDSDSAYEPADRMVLARVPKERIADRDRYEFFVRVDRDGEPVWSRDIADRGTVFEHPGRVYRSGISYNAGLGRYIWYQPLPGEQLQHDGGRTDIRFEGGMGVYDAPEPWGPWTTAYFTPRWDVGPGESGNFPTGWMSDDGRTMHLVFSGDDYFSVRQATLRVADQPR